MKRLVIGVWALLALGACMKLRAVKIKLLAPLLTMEQIMQNASTHTIDCGTTKTGVWVLAYQPETCPPMKELDQQAMAAAKLTLMDPTLQAGSTLILYNHTFMCGDLYAIGCTSSGLTMAVDIREGYKVFRHELFHEMLYANGSDGDPNHLACWQWHQVDPDRPECFDSPLNKWEKTGRD